MLFNINEIVRVKITNKGKEILRNKHDAFLARWGSSLSEESKVFTLPEEDENGYSRWQLWSLMHEFGEYVNIGHEPPFNLTIDIPIKEIETAS